MARIFYTLLLIILLPLTPWWLFAVLALLGMIIFRRYGEAIALFFFYDLLFGLPHGGWLGTQFSFTIISIVVFLLIEGYRDRLRFYQD